MICDIQRFSLNDGPGIRTTVFLKGCPLSCKWCHNPEAIQPKAQILYYPQKCIGCAICELVCPTGARRGIPSAPDRTKCIGCGKCVQVCYAGALVLSGRDASVSEILDEVREDIPYYAHSGGGVTISGGESLFQADFTAGLLAACRAEGIATAIETCLAAPYAVLEALLPLVDLIMADVKLADPQKHKQWTGMDNELILQNLKRLSGAGVPLIIRTPVIPGVNDTKEDIAAIAEIVRKVDHLVYYELLNFNPLGESKYEALGILYALKGVRPLPKEKMEFLQKVALDSGVPRVRIG